MGKPILLDTDVMVDFLRGHARAVAFVRAHSERIILSSIVMGDVPVYVALCEDGDMLMRGDPAKNARSARSPASLMNPLLNLGIEGLSFNRRLRCAGCAPTPAVRPSGTATCSTCHRDEGREGQTDTPRRSARLSRGQSS